MFSQSEDLSQSSNGDYNFLHSSQNSSQFEFEGLHNKNQNIFGVGELGIINEENPLSPIKINFKYESKKSLVNNTNISKTSKYSFGNVNNMAQKINIKPSIADNDPNPKKSKIQIQETSSNNKENINTINNNINLNNSNIEPSPNPNSNVNITLGEVKQGGENNFFNFDNYKCQLSQQIDQVEKIALQSMNASENSKNNNNAYNIGLINNVSEEELLEHQKFNQYCSDLIDQAMNKNIEYIDKIKKEFVNNLDTYKMKFRTNAEVIKKLILLYSDDVFQKEKNKIIISHLADQLLSHINSFFQEMSKFNNFNLNFNANVTNNDINSNPNP